MHRKSHRKSGRKSHGRKSHGRKSHGRKSHGVKAVGSRAQVMHGAAHHTSGGLTKNHLKYGKSGNIVSIKKSAAAKRHNRLGKYLGTKREGFVLRRRSSRMR